MASFDPFSALLGGALIAFASVLLMILMIAVFWHRNGRLINRVKHLEWRR